MFLITNCMKVRKTLTSIVLAGALALGGACYDTKSNENNIPQKEYQNIQKEYQIKNISGKIVSIDEDSFAMGADWKGANFEFEHLRVEATDGKIYKLIFPAPSNYQVGDSVNLQYRAQRRVSCQDLINEGAERLVSWPLQLCSFEVDGLIQIDKAPIK